MRRKYSIWQKIWFYVANKENKTPEQQLDSRDWKRIKHWGALSTGVVITLTLTIGLVYALGELV